jgi:hypothetical protein
VFSKKRLDLLDYKGFEFFEKAPFEALGKQEAARAWNDDG